jgi:hypothetical protein
MQRHQLAFLGATTYHSVKGIINLHLRLGPQQLSIHDHLMATVSPISTHEQILQAVDISVDDPDIILFTCSSKQQYNARILVQSLPLVLEAKYGEDAILEAFTPTYWQSARSTFSKDEHGNYVSRQDHLQGKGTAALKALDTQDNGTMEIKIRSYEDVVVDRADIPAPDLISNMEFLFAAKLTPAGLLQRTSVASAMEPSVEDATKASMGASTLAGTSVMEHSAVTKASFMHQSAVTKASFMSH